MTTVVFSPIGNGQQWFTNAGIPLSGGKINTYAAGSTTPVATYTDNTGGTPNANPIILDSTGRYAQEIWWVPGQLLKFFVTDSAGTTIGTYDNLQGIGDLAYAVGTAPSIAVSGNATIGGTLGVTGVSTLSGGAVITGVIDGSAAASGVVGEDISSNVAQTTSNVSSGVVISPTSISLTAGDWDINVIGYFAPAATTSVTQYIAGFSTTNGTTLPNQGQRIIFAQAASVPNAVSEIATGPIRLSLNATTTVFLNIRSTFTVSTMTGGGQISARRAR